MFENGQTSIASRCRLIAYTVEQKEILAYLDAFTSNTVMQNLLVTL